MTGESTIWPHAHRPVTFWPHYHFEEIRDHNEVVVRISMTRQFADFERALAEAQAAMRAQHDQQAWLELFRPVPPLPIGEPDLNTPEPGWWAAQLDYTCLKPNP